MEEDAAACSVVFWMSRINGVKGRCLTYILYTYTHKHIRGIHTPAPPGLELRYVGEEALLLLYIVLCRLFECVWR